HQHPAGVLHLEEVLDEPVGAAVCGTTDVPRQRLREVVAPDLDVGRHEVLDVRVLPAEIEALSGGFDVIVDILDGARAVPVLDRLGVPDGGRFEIREIRVDHGGPGGPHVDADAAAHGRVAVDIAPIEDEVVRVAPQPDQRHEERAGGGADLYSDEPEVVRAGRRSDREGPHGTPDHDLRHHRRV